MSQLTEMIEQLHKDSAAIIFTFGKGWISRLIRWQQRSPVSHVAIAKGNQVWEAKEFQGVRKDSYLEFADRHRGEFFICPFKTASVPHDIEMMRFLDKQVGKAYDYRSVIRFVTRRQDLRKQTARWFCSEYGHQAMIEGGCNPLARSEPCNTSPGLLATSISLQYVCSPHRWHEGVVRPATLASILPSDKTC